MVEMRWLKMTPETYDDHRRVPWLNDDYKHFVLQCRQSAQEEWQDVPMAEDK